MIWLNDLLSNPVALGFLAVITLVAALAHLCRFTTASVTKVPTILTMLGILGTFVGITAGLLNFDTANIQASMPYLISGIRTAFIASLAGVFWAITIKARNLLFPAASVESGSEGATVDDLLGQLAGVQQALVGGDDSTILSQLKLGRQDVNDRLDALKRSQQEFMAKMADMNSKALISALELVIRDFNVKITEQFGENFKQLNVAVGKLLEWQEKYRQQLTELVNQQAITSASMTTATERYSKVVDDAAKFADVANRFQTILGPMETYQASMQRTSTELAALINSASNSLPSVEQKIVALTERVASSARNHEAEVAKVASEISTAFRSAADSVRSALTSTIESASQQLNVKLEDSSRRLDEQIVKLDRALEKELTESLQGLGKQLAALSSKFVEDYTPLTSRLRTLVGIGASVS
jgi:DNA anti-recombination protein RmuC